MGIFFLLVTTILVDISTRLLVLELLDMHTRTHAHPNVRLVDKLFSRPQGPFSSQINQCRPNKREYPNGIILRHNSNSNLIEPFLWCSNIHTSTEHARTRTHTHSSLGRLGKTRNGLTLRLNVKQSHTIHFRQIAM